MRKRTIITSVAALAVCLTLHHNVQSWGGFGKAWNDVKHTATGFGHAVFAPQSYGYLQAFYNNADSGRIYKTAKGTVRPGGSVSWGTDHMPDLKGTYTFSLVGYKSPVDGKEFNWGAITSFNITSNSTLKTGLERLISDTNTDSFPSDLGALVKDEQDAVNQIFGGNIIIKNGGWADQPHNYYLSLYNSAGNLNGYFKSGENNNSELEYALLNPKEKASNKNPAIKPVTGSKSKPKITVGASTGNYGRIAITTAPIVCEAPFTYTVRGRDAS
ncbi:hypothetical protein HOL34_00745 [bacterium]|nr:hypothetical protein [bacterium]MBT3903230.1 hypothetical protein [bacterium]MBT4578185.1 hypothetical protein [bacterium]MBT5345554.1 hypothetical protein [bacterium]MBT6131087.1 hypothetical protein [bacterium]